MFEYNDERRSKHDSPVTPPLKNRHKLTEAQRDGIRAERLATQHKNMRDSALAAIDSVDSKIAEYYRLIRQYHKTDYGLARYYAARCAQLKKHAAQLAIELVLTGTDVAPWKTVVFLTGVVRGLLDVRVTAKVMPQQPYKAPPAKVMPLLPVQKLPPAIQPHSADSEISAIISEFNRQKIDAEYEKVEMIRIQAERKERRLAELGL